MRDGATTKTQDLRRRGGEETEDSHPVTPKPGMPGTPDWREEKQLQHRGAGEEEPEGAGSGMEILRKKRRNLGLVIRRNAEKNQTQKIPQRTQRSGATTKKISYR